MDKESIFELQKLDCNCNDCIFMVRNMERFNQSLEAHNRWQFQYFNVLKRKLIEKANWYRLTFHDLVRWDSLLTEAENMKYQFDKSTARISFGTCSKFSKDISFIPNTCQLETQKCFKHRKEI